MAARDDVTVCVRSFAYAGGAVLAVSIVAGACIRTTPFQSDPEVRDLTASELAALQAQSPVYPLRFVALGDTHDEYDDFEATAEAINARGDVQLVLIAGDMSDRGLLAEFEWSYGSYKLLDMPFLTVIGNHDALSNGAAIYEEMFGPLNYTFRYGDLKFVMFNSNTLEFPAEAPDRDWLSAEVRSLDGARGLVLVTHQDPTAPDDLPGGDNAAFYGELLQSPAIELVVYSHLKEFALRTKFGVPLLQCGTYQEVRTHTIVTMEDDGPTFQVCQFDVCSAVEPGPEEAG